MLRPSRLILAGLIPFLAAAVIGVLVASHWGPERTRAVLEMTLRETLGAPVEVRHARLYFGNGALSWLGGVLLDAEGIACCGPAEGGAGGDEGGEGASRFAIERLQARLDPLSLLGGRVEVRSVALEGVQAFLGGAAERGEAPRDLAIPAPAEEAEPLVGWLDALAVAAEEALSAPPPGLDVSLARASLRVRGPALAEGAAPWILELDEVSGQGKLRPAGKRSTIALSGRFQDGGDEAHVAIDLSRGPRGALRIEVDVDDLELGAAGPALAAVLPNARLSGRSALSFRAERPQEGLWLASAEISARQLDGALPRMGDGHPVPVHVAEARAGIVLDLNPERLRLERAFANAEGSELALSGEIERPLRMASSTVGSVGLDHYDLSRRDDLIAFLPPRQIARLQAALEPLRSGRVEEIRIEGQARLRDWLRAFDDEAGGLLPESVAAQAHFADFAVRAGENETIRDVSGSVRWQGDRIELRGVRGRRAGHWMPMLDATFEGVSNLAANTGRPEIPDAEDAPVMLGLGPMYDIVVDPDRPPGEMPKALLLSLDHVVHPTLVWPLRNVFARANPGEDGIRLLIEHAVWGKVPIRAEGVWTMQPSGERRVERVAVRIVAKRPLEGLAPLHLEDPVWARGRWHLDDHNLGQWHVYSSTGAFEAQGQNVRLVTYDLDLGISGHALGEGTVDFSNGEELPYWTTVRVLDAKAQGIVDKIGFDPNEATGEVTLDGQFHGELRPGRKVIQGMEGRLQVRATDGVILRRLPALLAIAKATDTFNPFGSRDEIKYSEIDAVLHFERGRVEAEELRIRGRDLRMLATGQVDAVDPEHPVEAVVGIFFFKAIDRVIGVVPVLSDLILGEDDNLMGAYVQLTGAWANPDASLVPLKTVASGPASFAIEGVPRFVGRAIRAIQSAFARPRPPDVAAPPPRGEDS